jgi:superfamily I DNA/RNA helicase
MGIQMAHEVISFDDMIYIPLVMNLRFSTYNWVCVDEAQDSNWCRRQMALRMVAPGGRLFFVGDDMQAIFGFTGADNDSLDQIKKEFRCTVFPMTVTRRCCKAVVTLAQTIVPDFKAHEGNKEGSTTEITEEDFDNMTLVSGEDAIICRNTAPLVKAAYKLIAKGVAAHVEGKEIGRDLIALLDRWKSIKTIVALKDKLNEYLEREVQKMMAAKKEMAADALADKVETIFTIMETLPSNATVETLRQDIQDLFADTPAGTRPATVSLMTAHRSKGREFKRVFGWGVAAYFPSRFAKQAWQIEQEDNLQYVLYTRAMDSYIDVVVAE